MKMILSKLELESNVWYLKNRIDDELSRLGWDREKRNLCIKRLYGKTSLLVLSNKELLDLLKRLRNLSSEQITTRRLSTGKWKTRGMGR